MHIYTGGTYDLLHAGHIKFLEACRELAGGPTGRLTVGVNSDEFVKQFKGESPTIPLSERMLMLQALSSVSRVTLNSGGEDSKPTIKRMNQGHKINAIAIGSDWFRAGQPAAYLEQMQLTWEWLYEMGISLIFVPRVYEQSSTAIKARIHG